jgi:HPt (histidine-containing phosphotransfer) domain-containing protein
MNDILNRLREWGCDIDGAMERFINDEELYVSCLDSVLSDENFEKLGEALKACNVDLAFECAHTLKGVLGNMGLTPLYDVVVKIVEPLRNGQSNGLTSDYNQLVAAKQQLEEIVGRGKDCQ